MRISSNYYALILNTLSNTENQEQTDVEQLSTNRRVNTPSDDPTAASLEVANLAETADAAQYQQNISSTQTLLQTASSTLNSVVTSLNSVISQGVQAANGTISSDQQTQMAETISGIRDQIISLANTQVQGVYLFAGTASAKPPFQLNADPTTGVTYNGNSGVNTVPVGDGETVQANIPGDQVFASGSGNVMQALTNLINALQSHTTANIESATTDVKNALNTVSLQQGTYNTVNSRLSGDNTYLQNKTVVLQNEQNNLVGANLSQVIMNLTQAQTTHQATLEATAKILPLSLLNYLQ